VAQLRAREASRDVRTYFTSCQFFAHPTSTLSGTFNTSGSPARIKSSRIKTA
jgi:hypothetical protein